MRAPSIDLLDPAYDADIHTAHRRARERSWYATTPMGIIVLRHAEVLGVLRDRRWREQGRDALESVGITSGPLWEWLGQIMATQEGEDHARLRRLVSQAFTPRQVERLRPMMRRTAHALLDAVIGDAGCEFVSAFAAPYPVHVIGELIGVPATDLDRFHGWCSDLSLAFGPGIASERERIESALGDLSDYVDALLAERRHVPGPDLTSALIEVEEQGDRLSAAELRAMVTVLIFGGQDTTQCQLACAISAFLDSPEQWRLLAERPALAASAAEEVLRYEPAGSGAPRVATEDLVVNGLEIPGGTVALPSGPAANRDPAVYPDPDRLDITRQHAEPQLTFGGGAHYCLGASLARAELQEALPILAGRLGEIGSAGPIEWRRRALIRGPVHLPLAFAGGPA